MTTESEWYVAMGEAVKERSRAQAMVDNWQEKVRAAEARIDALATRTVDPAQVAAEQAQEQ